MELSLFIILLFSIFFAFTLYASFLNLKGEFSFRFQSFSQIQNQTIEENIQTLSEELVPYLHKIQNTLPADNYSFGRSELENLEALIKNLNLLAGQISYAQNALNTLVATGSAKDVLAFLHYNQTTLSSTVKQLNVLVYSLDSLPFLPETLVLRLEQLKILMPYFRNIDNDLQTLYVLLGDSEPHTIVIWLQNAYEKRNTGGFIGSFIEVVLNDGDVSRFKVHDIYKYDGQLLGTDTVPALAQTLVGDKTWSLRDANYSPRFEDSAQAFSYFYEQAGGNTIDTVIAIDNTMIERLLDTIGGIEIPEYNVQLTSKNFSFVLSFLVEGKFDEQNPKSFISAVVLPKFIQKLKSQATIDFAKSFYQQEHANIQLFSRNADINALAQRYEIGRNFDELVRSNNNILLSQISISGNKSDAYVKQDFGLKNLGNGFWEIQIDRFHNWGNEQEKQFNFLTKEFGAPSIPEQELQRILGAGGNRPIFQILFPAGTKNIAVNNGKTLQWEQFHRIVYQLELDELLAGENQSVVVSFQLPAFSSYADLVLWNQ